MIKKNQQKRASSLDALRGYAILTMVLSGTIANTLPSWMYHAQVPPPDHIFTPTIYGITWVDLVFPFFLFAMGAALPFSLGRKFDQGVSVWHLSFDSVIRGLQLAFFAIFLQHIYPWSLSNPQDYRAWFITLGAFLLLFPMFMRLPWQMPRWLRFVIKTGAYGIAILMLLTLNYADGKAFNLSNSNIIILVLANMAVFGSLSYIFTIHSRWWRIAILPFIMAIFLCRTNDFNSSWQKALFDFTPFDWLYKFYYLKYLFIVIPGTIAGEYLMEWLSDLTLYTSEYQKKEKKVAIVLSFITVALIVWNLYGLFTRQLVINLFVSIGLLAAGFILLHNATTSYLKFWKKMFTAGSFLLLLGLFFEAFEGGIRKDSSTFSYYFVTSGLAFFALSTFSVLCDFFQWKRSTAFLTMSGQNPMIAYVGSSVVIAPLLHITGLMKYVDILTMNAWQGLLHGVIITTLVTLLTMFFTKLKWFWRT